MASILAIILLSSILFLHVVSRIYYASGTVLHETSEGQA